MELKTSDGGCQVKLHATDRRQIGHAILVFKTVKNEATDEATVEAAKAALLAVEGAVEAIDQK